MRIPLLTTILALQLLGGIAQPIPKGQTNVVTSRGPLYKRVIPCLGPLLATVATFATGGLIATPMAITLATER
jgi:hypothetical protein